MNLRRALLLLAAASCAYAAPAYDLLLKHGHVIDPKNGISKPLDIAIRAGRIARVAPGIPAESAARVADVRGLYVTPGLIDIHAHVYSGTGLRSLTGDLSVYPDGFTFRTGVTTIVDAGSSGYRNFPDFLDRVITRAKTRVLAFLNIGAAGMAPKGENDPAEFNAASSADMARRHPDVIVGFKVAHYLHPDWLDIDTAVQAATPLALPVMVDFGLPAGDRNLPKLLASKLRPGDIYTHCYSAHRGEMDDAGHLSPAFFTGRRRGIFFDVGHGGGSFYWTIAVPALAQGFPPDSISTDLHTGSMNAGMKDMANVMSKLLNLGIPVEDVIRMSTWNPACEIKRRDLGNLDPGAVADITVLALETGNFGFLDSEGARRAGTRRLTAELTIRNGAVVWDLNGRAAPDWTEAPYKPPHQRRP